MQQTTVIIILIALGAAHCQSTATDARSSRTASGTAAQWPSWLPPDQLLRSSQQVPNADVEVAHQSLGALMPRRTGTGPDAGPAVWAPGQNGQRAQNAAGASQNGAGRAAGLRPRRNPLLLRPQQQQQPQSQNDAPLAAAALPRPALRSSAALRQAPAGKWLMPGEEHTFMPHMLAQLGLSFNPDFMSVSDRNGQVEREAFGPKYAFDPELRRLVDAMNLSAYEPEAAALTWEVQSVFKSVLLRQASCLVEFRWNNEGPYTWPRYIKRGYCQNAMPCSWPPGMSCQVSGTKKLQVLKWQCYEEDTNALPDDRFPMVKRDRRSSALVRGGPGGAQAPGNQSAAGQGTGTGPGRRGQQLQGGRRRLGAGGQRRYGQGLGARQFSQQQRARQGGQGQGTWAGGNQRQRAQFGGQRRLNVGAPLGRAPGVQQTSRLGSLPATQQQQQRQRPQQVGGSGPGSGSATDMQADDTQAYKSPGSDSSDSQALSANGITCRWQKRELPVTEKCACMCLNQANP